MWSWRPTFPTPHHSQDSHFSILSSSDPTFTPNHTFFRKSKIQSLKIGKEFHSKASNWTKIQFTRPHYAQEFSSLGSQLSPVVCSQVPLFGAKAAECRHRPKWKLSAPLANLTKSWCSSFCSKSKNWTFWLMGGWDRPIASIYFLGGVGPPKVDLFGPKKWTFWTSLPLTLLQNPHFWPILWLKVELLADVGGVLHLPHPPCYSGRGRGVVVPWSWAWGWLCPQYVTMLVFVTNEEEHNPCKHPTIPKTLPWKLFHSHWSEQGLFNNYD